MEDEKFEFTIEYGKITNKSMFYSLKEADVKYYDPDKMMFCDKHIPGTHYNDFSDLNIDDDVVILTYTYTWPDTRKTIIYGLIDRKKYENPIRESQKLPKGWIHEPRFKVDEQYGTITKVDDFGIYFKIDGEDTEKYTTMRDCNLFADRKVGNNIVYATFTIDDPGGVKCHRIVVHNIEKYNEFRKELEQKYRK